MGCQVCMGAVLKCSFGMAPSTLVVPPMNRTYTRTSAANILDGKPLVNVPPFGMCKSPTNPAVAAATLLALGKLTPMPCVPMTLRPWEGGARRVLLGNKPVLDDSAKLMCRWGGVISVVSPGQFTVQVP